MGCFQGVIAMDGTRLPARNQIVIIGNGFDLECGLDSRFSDFFAERRPLLDATLEEVHAAGCTYWGRYLSDRGITAWDVVLAAESDDLWCDVEGAIARWVEPHDKGETVMGGVVRELRGTTALTKIPGLRESASANLASKLKTYDARVLDEAPEKALAIFLAQAHRQDVVDILKGRRSIASVMLGELHRFEREFAAYMRRMLEAHEGYAERSADLLRQILGYAPSDEEPGERPWRGAVLNFNYTVPGPSPSADASALAMVNVHGRLEDDDIVFGIDGREYMESDDTLPFTKTYRLLALGTEGIAHIADGVRMRSEAVDRGSAVDTIKFYGHSLNAADYSYFQALFDGVDIYGGSTRLLFLYRPWRDGSGRRVPERAAREDLYRRVTHLLAEYGSTMDNADHGKNLVHKLLLEGRLAVRRLPGEDH